MMNEGKKGILCVDLGLLVMMLLRSRLFTFFNQTNQNC